MRVLLTGASGLLGGNLLFGLPSTWTIVGIGNHYSLDHLPAHIRYVQTDLLGRGIADIVRDVYRGALPDVIVHTAALTNVDRCEGVDRTLASAMHSDLTDHMARFAADHGVHLIHISTDHIFDGVAGNYREIDAPHPINHYAATKWEAEERVQASGADAAIVRTNFFGWNIQPKNDFAGWIVGSLTNGKALRLFDDVFFSPILVNTLVEDIALIIERRLTGVMHVAAADGCSKYDFGMKLADLFSLDTRLITPTSVDVSDLRVPRPKRMTLDTTFARNVLGLHIPTVDESVRAYATLSRSGYAEQIKRLGSPA